jgi:Recombinase
VKRGLRLAGVGAAAGALAAAAAFFTAHRFFSAAMSRRFPAGDMPPLRFAGAVTGDAGAGASIPSMAGGIATNPAIGGSAQGHQDRPHHLVPGPEDEVGVVREIFDWFVNERLSEDKIAARLNAKGIPTTTGGRWRHKPIRDMLSNPKYVGDSVYSRTTQKLATYSLQRRIRHKRAGND